MACPSLASSTPSAQDFEKDSFEYGIPEPQYFFESRYIILNSVPNHLYLPTSNTCTTPKRPIPADGDDAPPRLSLQPRTKLRRKLYNDSSDSDKSSTLASFMGSLRIPDLSSESSSSSRSIQRNIAFSQEGSEDDNESSHPSSPHFSTNIFDDKRYHLTLISLRDDEVDDCWPTDESSSGADTGRNSGATTLHFEDSIATITDSSIVSSESLQQGQEELLRAAALPADLFIPHVSDEDSLSSPRFVLSPKITSRSRSIDEEYQSNHLIVENSPSRHYEDHLHNQEEENEDPNENGDEETKCSLLETENHKKHVRSRSAFSLLSSSDMKNENIKKHHVRSSSAVSLPSCPNGPFQLVPRMA